MKGGREIQFLKFNTQLERVAGGVYVWAMNGDGDRVACLRHHLQLFFNPAQARSTGRDASLIRSRGNNNTVGGGRDQLPGVYKHAQSV